LGVFFRPGSHLQSRREQVTDAEIIADALKHYAARAVGEAGAMKDPAFRFPGGGRPTAKQVSNAFRLAERARQLWLNQRGKA
jgi:hypothetical protein